MKTIPARQVSRSKRDARLSGSRSVPAVWFLALLTLAATATSPVRADSGQPCFEIAPIRPVGGDYVPPPFGPVVAEGTAVTCGIRSYDLTGAVPVPAVDGRPLLQEAAMVVNGSPLTPPAVEWTLSTRAVTIARRSWTAGRVRLELTQTVEYDGFITSDLKLAPVEEKAIVREVTLRLVFLPEASVLYHIPSTSKTPAGFWPERVEISDPIPGVWSGDDQFGLACYIATFRDWRNAGPRIVLTREGRGAGVLEYRIVSEPVEIDAPVTYRLGFIATPVRQPEARHWQLFSLPPTLDDLQRYVDRNLFWSQISDRYATFRTNDSGKDAEKIEAVGEVHHRGKKALAYTTYAHVEEGAAETPSAWLTITAKGRKISSSIGGSMADRKRTFCCPGSHSWIAWKIEDLRRAIERYGVDGFYIDTSYILLACANREHGHGWLDGDGALQTDFPTWSMREIWRQSYELLCRARGEAEVYAHHKAGCPPALAAFTTAFCDGEQYTSQSIKNLTPDAFRAQIAGRNVGPLALFLCEYYRSQHYGMHEAAEHHNPTESVMLPLMHDVLPTGYPGNHPVRELLLLSDDLGIAESTWIPYYAAGNPWRAEGADGLAVSAYRTARGDTLLVIANPGYTDARFRLAGPAEAIHGRTFVAIDVLARIGRHSPSTAGYRWEAAEPGVLSLPARGLALFAWVEAPASLAGFAKQEGFAGSDAAHQRRVPVPEEATLLDDFEDPDWTMANDQGGITTTDREPIDTRRALRVVAKPEHNAAAILRTFDRPQDWSTCESISLWIRPERDQPVRAFEVRLRDSQRYLPAAKLVSHGPKDVLPADVWTQLRYDFGSIPRNEVRILRLYYHRGELVSGSFDVDEVMLHGGKAAEASIGPQAKKRQTVRPAPIDRPGATPQ